MSVCLEYKNSVTTQRNYNFYKPTYMIWKFFYAFDLLVIASFVLFFLFLFLRKISNCKLPMLYDMMQ